MSIIVIILESALVIWCWYIIAKDIKAILNGED